MFELMSTDVNVVVYFIGQLENTKCKYFIKFEEISENTVIGTHCIVKLNRRDRDTYESNPRDNVVRTYSGHFSGNILKENKSKANKRKKVSWRYFRKFGKYRNFVGTFDKDTGWFNISDKYFLTEGYFDKETKTVKGNVTLKFVSKQKNQFKLFQGMTGNEDFRRVKYSDL